ncbi:deoxyuridine 5'-triphosphate nucleotidohydrolase protein [Rhizobium phage RHph_I1_18]|nr:deoxyuridine 5'-triphosphate nucleotidohydrolase protein [Rhizobium phage RHph_I1_18]
MFLNIASQLSKSSLTGILPVDVQPNAVDIRIDRVFRFAAPGLFIIDEDSKTHAEKIEVLPEADGYWTLFPGSYEVQMEGIVSIGANETGWVITRSTLNRNGVFITSGLYDSGYTGAMAGAMHITTVPMKIKRGTRIGQFVLAIAEALHAYDGSYGLNADGSAKADEQVYHK